MVDPDFPVHNIGSRTHPTELESDVATINISRYMPCGA